MTLLVLVIAATLSGLAAGAIAWRWAGRAGAPRTEAAVARSRWARRLDPQAATGLALTVAFAVIVLGGLVLAVLAYLVRGNTEVVRIDSGVAEWGARNASGFATDVLTAISHVGEPKVVIALAALVAIAETIRTRSRWVIPFMALVVAGNGLITTTVKELADRARPTLNPIAETLGPSFPSGHSSWSAAFFAATALLATRGRSRRARTLIVGACTAAAVSIAATRVLLGVHWLSDVIAGLALGSAWFCVCAVACGGRLLRFGAPAEEAERKHDSSVTAGAGGGVSPAADPVALLAGRDLFARLGRRVRSVLCGAECLLWCPPASSNGSAEPKRAGIIVRVPGFESFLRHACVRALSRAGARLIRADGPVMLIRTLICVRSDALEPTPARRERAPEHVTAGALRAEL